MDIEKINRLLMAITKEGVSDIHFKAGSPPKVRKNGELVPVKYEVLSSDIMEDITMALLSEHQKRFFEKLHELDFSHSIPKFKRYRVNVYKQRGSCALIFRIVPIDIPTIEELNIPKVIKTIAQENRGLILVTGVTGSGKSTTLASMINHINNIKRCNILTIEDPIEFLHKDKLSSISQREVGSDTTSFSRALRVALRQDPDVILVGEMRDRETISIAIKAAETGHLVLSTLHTTDAAGTVHRIIDTYPPDQQQQIRLQLAENLKAVISQRLLPKKDGSGRIVAAEIMIGTTTVQNFIIEPEKTLKLKEVIESGRSQYETQSFDQTITDLYKEGKISFEVAIANASTPSDFQRALQFS